MRIGACLSSSSVSTLLKQFTLSSQDDDPILLIGDLLMSSMKSEMFMMMKDSLFLLISNVLGRGPSNDDEGISVSTRSKCFTKWVWGWGGGPSNDDEEFFVSADFKCFR